MNDLISRQKAINTAHSMRKACDTNSLDDYHDLMVASLKMLPSAERHGKWLHGQGFAGNYFDCLVCDQCEKESMAKTNYCPNCGADMGGEHSG